MTRRAAAAGDLARIVKIRRVRRDMLGSRAGAAAAALKELADARPPLEDRLAQHQAGYSRALSSRVIAPEMLLAWQAGVRRAAAALQQHEEREAAAEAEALQARRTWNEAQVRAGLAEEANRNGMRHAARARDEHAIAQAEDLARARRAVRCRAVICRAVI